MDHEDQIDVILDGLPEEYKNVVDQIEGRELPPSINELHEKLLHHEAKLSSTKSSPIRLVSGNMVQQKGKAAYNNTNKNKQHNNYYNNPQARPNYKNNNLNWQSQSRSPRPYLGKCQICGTQGHEPSVVHNSRATMQLRKNLPSLPGNRVLM